MPKRKGVDFTFAERVSFARATHERKMKKFGSVVNPTEILISLQSYRVLDYHAPSDTYRVREIYKDELLPDDLNDVMFNYNNSAPNVEYRLKKGLPAVMGERKGKCTQ